MQHNNIVKIYHHDTDCYGVVWHGAYIKWFEIGRVELSKLIGIDLEEVEKQNIFFPVVELNCRYKTPSQLYDELSITTTIKKLKKTSITFFHEIKNIHTEEKILEATSVIVTIDKDGKIYRKMPEFIYNAYFKAVNAQEVIL